MFQVNKLDNQNHAEGDIMMAGKNYDIRMSRFLRNNHLVANKVEGE